MMRCHGHTRAKAKEFRAVIVFKPRSMRLDKSEHSDDTVVCGFLSDRIHSQGGGRGQIQ